MKGYCSKFKRRTPALLLVVVMMVTAFSVGGGFAFGGFNSPVVVDYKAPYGNDPHTFRYSLEFDVDQDHAGMMFELSTSNKENLSVNRTIWNTAVLSRHFDRPGLPANTNNGITTLWPLEFGEGEYSIGFFRVDSIKGEPYVDSQGNIRIRETPLRENIYKPGRVFFGDVEFTYYGTAPEVINFTRLRVVWIDERGDVKTTNHDISITINVSRATSPPDTTEPTEPTMPLDPTEPPEQ
jgi:hypothetical protein